MSEASLMADAIRQGLPVAPIQWEAFFEGLRSGYALGKGAAGQEQEKEEKKQ